MEGIVLNSSIIQHPEKVVDEEVRQREWLEEELKKAIARYVQWIVIFQHSPGSYIVRMNPTSISIFLSRLVLAI
jgi:hypothetical protein